MRLYIVLPLLGAGLLWAYWPIVRGLVDRWWKDPHYTHGFLVPLFAIALPWLRATPPASRSKSEASAGSPSPTPSTSPAREITARENWVGVALIGLGAVILILGTYFYVAAEWLQALSLLPMIAGICTMTGGFPLLRVVWPSIAFLVFMIPLPYRVEYALGYPLQRLATLASTYVLQTLGFPAVAEGNIVRINEVQLAVVEACNGLGMLVTFVTIAVGLALVIDRRWEDKPLIILSAVPIALLANIARIIITGILNELVSSRWGDAFFHDFAGWLMMPLALALLWAELWLLAHLLIEPPSRREVPIAIGLVDPVAAVRRSEPRTNVPRPAPRRRSPSQSRDRPDSQT
jgi:exosortase